MYRIVDFQYAGRSRIFRNLNRAVLCLRAVGPELIVRLFEGDGMLRYSSLTYARERRLDAIHPSAGISRAHLGLRSRVALTTRELAQDALADTRESQTRPRLARSWVPQRAASARSS